MGTGILQWQLTTQAIPLFTKPCCNQTCYAILINEPTLMPDIPKVQVEIDLYLHIRVLISIILGLSITRLVSGLARFIQHPERHEIWFVHVGWVVWLLFSVITFWWWEFRLIYISHWTLHLYLFVLLYATMFFLLSTLLFPDDLQGYKGYQDYFLSRRKWFFGIFAVTQAFDLIDTWIKGASFLRSLGIEYIFDVVVFIALYIIAAITRNLTFHTLFIIGVFVYEVSFIVRYAFSGRYDAPWMP